MVGTLDLHVVTLVRDSMNRNQVLTHNFYVNRRIDSDEDASQRRFDLTVSTSDVGAGTQCTSVRKFCIIISNKSKRFFWSFLM